MPTWWPRLTWVGTSVVFDNTSRFLAVATFDQYDGRKPGGAINFWRLTGDYFDPKRSELVRTS